MRSAQARSSARSISCCTAIAFASLDDLKRDTIETSRDGFKMAMEISAYSLMAVANAAREIMTTARADR